MTDEPALLAELDQVQAAIRDQYRLMHVLLAAQRRCHELDADFLNLLDTHFFITPRVRRARDLAHQAHILFMQRRYQEVLDL